MLTLKIVPNMSCKKGWNLALASYCSNLISDPHSHFVHILTSANAMAMAKSMKMATTMIIVNWQLGEQQQAPVSKFSASATTAIKRWHMAGDTLLFDTLSHVVHCYMIHFDTLSSVVHCCILWYTWHTFMGQTFIEYTMVYFYQIYFGILGILWYGTQIVRTLSRKSVIWINVRLQNLITRSFPVFGQLTFAVV